jgi:RNA polymerase sigma-70 factor (ECF subfamily)
MTIQLPTFSERELNKLARDEWSKALAFLHKQFGLSEDECKDIFQEAFVILHNNNLSGKLENMTSSLSTYFYGICRNKAYEAMRKNGKNVHVEDEVSLDVLNAEIQADKIDALIGLENESNTFVERKEALVRQIVRELPSPCNELLWGFFRDNFSMKTLAQMFNYNSENSVKVTKHRCQNKFRDRFNELKDQLF